MKYGNGFLASEVSENIEIPGRLSRSFGESKISFQEKDKMKCPKCQFDNPEAMKVCGECVAKLEIICSKCNFFNPPQFKFCGECRQNLTPHQHTPPIEYSEPQSYTPKISPCYSDLGTFNLFWHTHSRFVLIFRSEVNIS